MIQDLKLRQLFNIQKSLKVKDRELSNNGLCIYYLMDEELKVLYADVPETCQLLFNAGLITNFSFNYPNSYIGVQWETETNHSDHNGEHVQECKTVYGSFEDFVSQTKFSSFDALTIAALYELQKQQINKNQKQLI